MIVVVMGVAGSGKTTIGRLLAAELGWSFHDADDLHSAANVEKMRHGIGLTDADRTGWLAAVAHLIHTESEAGRSAVVACSALKASYRALLAAAAPEVVFVYLKADPAVLRTRLEQRTGHFVHADLLASQLATLEEPSDALTIDAAEEASAIVARIESDPRLRLESDGKNPRRR